MNGFRQFRLVKNEINWLGDLDTINPTANTLKPEIFSSGVVLCGSIVGARQARSKTVSRVSEPSSRSGL